jgi:hypothetical protein
VEFGLEVTERDKGSGAVNFVICKFCRKFGREHKPGQKRKRITNFHIFKLPFRTDSYQRHHATAHPEKWDEFSRASLEENRTFFDGVVNHSSTLLAHFESEGALTLTFNRDIVEKVIGDLLFDPDDASCQSTREKGLAIFQHFDDAALDEESTGATPSAIIPEQELNPEAYLVRVNSVRMFKMVIGFVSKGASFRSASRFVAIAKDVKKMNYLSGCSEGRLATFVRIVCASSLQGIHEMLCGSWAYYIALDVGHAQGTSYLDVRVRFCTPSGTIANYHVLAICCV